MAGRAPTEGTTGGAPHTHPGVLRGVGAACTWRWPPPRATPNWYRRGVPGRGPPRANKPTESRKKWDSGRWGGPGASEHPRLGLDSVAAEGGLKWGPPPSSPTRSARCFVLPRGGRAASSGAQTLQSSPCAVGGSPTRKVKEQGSRATGARQGRKSGCFDTYRRASQPGEAIFTLI